MPALSIIVSITGEHRVTVKTQVNKPMTILCLGDKNHIKGIFPQLSSMIIRVFLGEKKKRGQKRTSDTMFKNTSYNLEGGSKGLHFLSSTNTQVLLSFCQARCCIDCIV